MPAREKNDKEELELRKKILREILGVQDMISATAPPCMWGKKVEVKMDKPHRNKGKRY